MTEIFRFQAGREREKPNPILFDSPIMSTDSLSLSIYIIIYIYYIYMDEWMTKIAYSHPRLAPPMSFLAHLGIPGQKPQETPSNSKRWRILRICTMRWRQLMGTSKKNLGDGTPNLFKNLQKSSKPWHLWDSFWNYVYIYVYIKTHVYTQEYFYIERATGC